MSLTRPWGMGFGDLWVLIKESVKDWKEDDGSSMGAALSYYAFFSLAPLLVITVALGGLIFDHDTTAAALVDQFAALLGDDAREMMQRLMAGASITGKGITATVVGVVLMIFGATTVFGEIQDSLDRVWDAPPRPDTGVLGLIRARVVSFGLVLGVGFLLVISLVFSTAVTAIGKWWGGWFGDAAWLLLVANFVLSFALMTGLFGMIYKIVPRVPIAWHDVWVGSAVTSLLLSLGKIAIGLYLGHSKMGETYGSAAAVVVLWVWLYYSAQIFLLGAEFTHAFAERHGSLRADRASLRKDNARGRPTAGPGGTKT